MSDLHQSTELHEMSLDFKARHIMLGVPLSCTACRFFRVKYMVEAPTNKQAVYECTHSVQRYMHASYIDNSGNNGNQFSGCMKGNTCSEFTLTRAMRLYLLNNR